MQVYDIIELLVSKFADKRLELPFKNMYLIYKRIGFHYRQKLLLHGKMHLSAWQLLLDAAYDRGCQHDISDGAQPNDKYLVQARIFYKCKTSAVNSPNFAA